MLFSNNLNLNNAVPCLCSVDPKSSCRSCTCAGEESEINLFRISILTQDYLDIDSNVLHETMYLHFLYLPLSDFTKQIDNS